MKLSFQKTFLAGLVMVMAMVSGWSNPANANLNFAQTPLFASVPIDPNIIFTLDDSGSMHWEFMPDGLTFQYFLFPRPVGLYGAGDYPNRVPLFWDNNLHNFVLRSSHNNAVFYDPDRTYRPWVNWDGTEMAEADPECAFYNPRNTALGCLDLTRTQTANAIWSGNTNSTNMFGVSHAAPGLIGQSNISATQTFTPITYFIYKDGSVFQRSSYDKIEITVTDTPASATFTSPSGIVRTRDEEIQNFANWFQYHRSRVLTARGGIGRAFLELPENVRLGFGSINAASRTVDGVNTRTIIDPVRQLDTVGRQAFYDRLYDLPIPTFGTPLRRSAMDVGRYFERTDNLGPWSSTPGVNTPGETSSSHLSCRQSYHILMTDGFWNGPNQGLGNIDDTDGELIQGDFEQSFQYIATDPFRDDFSDTLGDIAMYFWKRDLRPDLPNRVPASDLNPAFWQHLTTFGIGLGVEGNIDPEDAFKAIATGDEIAWPNPGRLSGGEIVDRDSPAAAIDDLLHFGLNGRGGFFSASDPDVFAEELGRVLREIVGRASATSGLSASSTRLDLGALVYSAQFDASEWSGDLLAIDAGTNATLYSAAARLAQKGPAARNILTFNPSTGSGVAFSASGAIRDRVMQNAPGGWAESELFSYIRGDLNAGDGVFRERDSMMGSVVNSQPVFSGAGNEGWGRVYSDYFDYIDGAKRDSRNPCAQSPCPGSRRDVVLVGSNGGTLHAFDAKNLEEYFAYVPAAIHADLHQLADPDVNHRFFVDGQIAVSDVRWGANDWRTVAIGNLGAGGRGVYAIDITKPQSVTASNVLWEFTHEDDPDMGYGFGAPAISRLSDGTWVAIFGNGYNSASGQAYLFVLDVKTGNQLAKIKVGPEGGNGLSGVAATRDTATRSHVDKVYAGDLQGNMWRFDLADPDSMSVGLGGLPLFSVPGNRAIVSSPDVALHPVEGRVVYFGSGRLLENNDRLSVSGWDHFYAVRDRGQAVTGTNGMSEVAVSAGPQEGVRVFQAQTAGADGWFVRLGLSQVGERVLSSPQVFAGRVIFNTFEPSVDPCIPGGITRTQVLNAFTGSGALQIDADGNPCIGCGGIEVGTGAAVAPVIGIVGPVGSTPGELGDPGYEPPPCDPDDPDCNEGEDPSNPPPDATGGRDDWCSQYGILGMGGNFLRLGTVCEGRQVWREVR